MNPIGSPRRDLTIGSQKSNKMQELRARIADPSIPDGERANLQEQLRLMQ